MTIITSIEGHASLGAERAVTCQCGALAWLTPRASLTIQSPVHVSSSVWDED